MAIQTKGGACDRLAQLVCKNFGVFWFPQASLNDCKFVATQARDQIAVTKAAAKALRDLLQELVASRMAERIVYTLEMVEIEAKHRKLCPSSHKRKFLFKLLTKECAIWKLGQRVIVCETGNPFLGDFSLSHIIDNSQDILGLIPFIPERDPTAEYAARTAVRRQNLAFIEYWPTRLQELIIPSLNPVGFCLREYFSRGPSNHSLPRYSPKTLGRLVHKDILTILGSLNENGRGDVLDDQV